MPLILNLTDDLENRLRQEAPRLGASPEAIALEATGDFLIRALDEDRSSDRKLFPPETRGVSW